MASIKSSLKKVYKSLSGGENSNAKSISGIIEDISTVASPGGDESNVEIVTVIKDGSTYIADKTYTQLMGASKQGKACIARLLIPGYGDLVTLTTMPLMVSGSYENAQGNRIYVYSSGASMTITVYELKITNSGATYTEKSFNIATK